MPIHLLKIISGLLLPEQGTVTVDGLTPGKDDKQLKASVGLTIDEERSFYWRLTGRQNLEFFAALYGLAKIETKAKIEELFSF